MYEIVCLVQPNLVIHKTIFREQLQKATSKRMDEEKVMGGIELELNGKFGQNLDRSKCHGSFKTKIKVGPTSWNRMAWNGLGSNKLECWKRRMIWNYLEQNGMAWNGMGSNKMECWGQNLKWNTLE